MTVNIAELIDKLCICNNKLFEVCNLKANCDSMTKEELVKLCKKDIALCRERAALKNEINKAFGHTVEEVKNYGG
jgi:hypothetical protein